MDEEYSDKKAFRAISEVGYGEHFFDLPSLPPF
jgi:hypothetical protein